MKSAIGDKLKELANTIAVYQSGNSAGALELVRSGRGKAYMDRVREVISSIRQNENAVLQARLAAADSLQQMAGLGVDRNACQACWCLACSVH